MEEDPGSKKIDDAAYEYVEARDARMAATTVESQKASKLIAIVKRERPGQKAYKHRVGTETIEVKLTVKDPTEKVKVKIAPTDDEQPLGTEEADEPDTVGAMDAEEPAGDGLEDAVIE